MEAVSESDELLLLPPIVPEGNNYFPSILRRAAHDLREAMKIQSKFQFGTQLNCRFIWAILSLITIICLLLLYTSKSYQVRILPFEHVSHNITERWFKSSTTFKHIQSLSLPPMVSSYFHQKSPCSIEIYGAGGVEQDYIGGTLFRDIAQTCSCYTHYRLMECFVNDTLQVEASALNQTHNIGRLVWCVGQCPGYITDYCMNEAHSDFCKKHVVMINLSDEIHVHNTASYPYFAAVYRNYLRHGTGNHLSYLAEAIRKLPQTNDSLHFHRILNWSLAIDIMRDEWKTAGIDVDDVSVIPALDMAAQLNNRIVKRLLLDNEGITYHTWPDLDAKIRNYTQNNVPVFWLPMGHTMYYFANEAKFSVGPLSKRRNLWSWTGSMKQNEREDMKNTFKKNDTLTDYIKQRGVMGMTGAFAEGPHFVEYTSQILDSQFIPLPRGGSPEQFRSYEAADSGAVLIVYEKWLPINAKMEMEPLAYLSILGYDPVTISNFTTLPKTLLELSRLPPTLLDDWQSIMLLRHTLVMHTMTKHMASVLCATNTPRGYVYQAGDELF